MLEDEAARDRDDISQGVIITKCEVSVDLECSKPFAEFIFHFFNGSLYPVVIETELDGYVRFGDGATAIDLQDRPERIKKKSFHNTRAEHDRYVRGEFIIVQKLSGADVDFMSSKRSRDAGFFIFDNLTVNVRRESATDVSRLRLNDIRPKLRKAFRLDSSALTAKREHELAKIYKLEVIRGLALQLWDGLRATGDATPEKVFREWQKRTMTYLTNNYGEQRAKEIYAHCTHDEPFPATATAQISWLQQFFAQYQYFVDEERKATVAML